MQAVVRTCPRPAAAALTVLVFLESDPSQNSVDSCGRTLAHVYVADLLVNQALIEQGFAHEYTYDAPYRYQPEFRAAEASSRGGNRALWSPGTCNGDTNRRPRPSCRARGRRRRRRPPRRPRAAGRAAAGLAPFGQGDPGYSSRLDRDGDGIACE